METPQDPTRYGFWPNRRTFQMSLASMLLAMIPLGIGFVFLKSLLNSRPLPWRICSRQILDEHLRKGKTVLVFFSADWNIESEYTEERIFKDPNFCRAMRSHGVVALRADRSESYATPDVKTLHESLSLTRQVPLIAVFPSATPEEPIVLDLVHKPIWKVKDVIEALERATSRLEDAD